MKTEITNLISVALSKAFNTDHQAILSHAIDEYIPGQFKSDFVRQFSYSLGPHFRPLIEETEPSLSLMSDGVAVYETFSWEGIVLSFENLIPFRFAQSKTFTFQNMIDLTSKYFYPREYKMPTREEILGAVITLLITKLNSISVLSFFVSNKFVLQEKFKSIYHAIGSRPIHEGILKTIAKEPDNLNRFNSQHLSWDTINRRSVQTLTDITRSYNLIISAERKTWKILENDAGEKKARIFDEALRDIQTLQCLPACVLDALHLGTHQSGFLNEAVIALGVYMTEISNYQITLPQSGVQRRLQFSIKNREVEIEDECQWHEVTAPQPSSGGSSLDRAHVSLRKPLTLTYRYTLSADKNNQVSHQIKELFLRNDHAVRALIPK